MKMATILKSGLSLLPATGLTALAADLPATNQPPRVPAFSVSYMDRSVDPAKDFYHFADGQWLKDNPVPPDKSRWAAFSELAERNWYLIQPD
jgi:predicted metalloendopeptidase